MPVGYYNPWEMLVITLIQAIIWLSVAALLIRLIARRWQERTGRPLHLFEHLFDGPPAMEILRQRYARGEVDAATFDEMRARIEGPGAATCERQSTTV
jgi:putative membrane protein